MKRLLALLFVTLPGISWAVEDVLPPEEAFHYEVEAQDDALIVRWDVRAGYYL